MRMETWLSCLVSVRFEQFTLHFRAFGFRDVHRDAEGDSAADCGIQQALLAGAFQGDVTADGGIRDVQLFADLDIGVALRLEALDFVHQCQRGRESAGHVLDQAAEQAVFLGHFNHYRRNFFVAESDEGFYAALAANKIVARFIALLRGPEADLNRLFQAEVLDALEDLLELFPFAVSRVDNANAVDGDELNFVVHAASWSFTRSAMPRK